MRTRQGTHERGLSRDGLDQSALRELLEMMRSADAGELMRRLLGTMLQELVDAEGDRVHRRRTAPAD